MAISGTESRFQNMKVLAEELEVNGVPVTGAGDGLLPVSVTALAGTMTGTTDGTIADVADVTGNTIGDINVAIADVNLQLKELQTKLNALIAALDG